MQQDELLHTSNHTARIDYSPTVPKKSMLGTVPGAHDMQGTVRVRGG